ncbi:MAG: GntR family transcriptional regulator [Veillonella sp.]
MEIPLAEELGVSRTPIREAIRKLELRRALSLWCLAVAPT